MPLYNGAIICCADGAWTEKILHVAKDVLGPVVDPHTHAGGVKNLADLNCPVIKDKLDQVVSVSIGLHGVRRVLMCNHWNCGAYGGSRAFSSVEEERKQHLEHLRERTKLIRDFLQRRVLEILRNPAAFPLVNFEQALNNLRQADDLGLDTHSFLLLPRDLDKPFSGEPEDCVPFFL